jgi:hypothetical protein
MQRLASIFVLILFSSLAVFAQGTSIGTAVALATTGSVNASINDQSANHFWKITTTTDGYLRLQISSSASIDVDVVLYDTDGTNSLAIDGRTGTASEVFYFVTPGTYYLRVYRSTGTVGSYSVFPNFTSPTRGADSEPNESPATAVALGPDGTSTGHVGYSGSGKSDADDYWKITTTEDGWLRVQVVSDSLDARGDARFDLDVTMHDVNGKTTIATDNRTGTFSQVEYFLRSGTYYVHVYRLQGRAGSYQIKSDLFTPALANDAEGNDSSQASLSATVNGTVFGHLGYYSNGTFDTQDYWKFTTTADGKVTVQIFSDSLDRSGKLFDLDPILLDTDGTLNYLSDGRSGTFSECVAFLRPGTYYVRVYRRVGNAASYSLKISATSPIRSNDVEGNDWFAQTSTLTYNLSSSGHLGYYSGGTTDTQDYWKLIAPSTDSVYFHVWSDSTLELDMYAYSADTSSMIINDGSSGTYSRVGIKTTAGASYYIRVYRWGGTAGSYTITSTRTATTDVARTAQGIFVPKELTLDQNYPNPFNPTTAIRYGVPEHVLVRVSVYSILGQEVALLANGIQTPATYTVTWNGRDKNGNEAPSGTYFLRLQAGEKQIVRKALLVR